MVGKSCKCCKCEKARIPYKISGSIDVIKNAESLILPGVGAAGQGMENLKEWNER
jgi:imidazoleglycerol phosphate synthase glutamine amidotransferase subunit HisH